MLDTFRADRVGKDGLTPNLDKLAKQSVVYDRAISSAPWTLPATASIFTGLLPSEHGACRRIKDGALVVEGLPNGAITLAESFRRLGYKTIGVCANAGNLHPGTGLAQGFEAYKANLILNGAELNRLVFASLTAHHDKQKPLFLFVNYMDTHYPYNSDPSLNPGRWGAIDRDPGLPYRLAEAFMPPAAPGDDQLAARVQEQYDCAVNNVDWHVGKLIRGLDRNLGPATIVIVTADHGEYFGEHKLVQHGKDLYEEAIHVPLIVRAPGVQPARISELVSTREIPRLIAEQLPTKVANRLAKLIPAVAQPHMPVFAELNYTSPRDYYNPVWGERFQRRRVAYYEGRFKAIASEDGNDEGFDIKNDPSESHNIASIMPDLIERARERISVVPPEGRKMEIGAEAYEQLRALGYL